VDHTSLYLLGKIPIQQWACLYKIEHSCRIVPPEHGDTILLLTDGIKEPEDVNGDVFGTEGVLNFIRLPAAEHGG